MSDNIKQNREKIKQLREQMISQLKNYSWTPIDGGFSNKHFIFRLYGEGVRFKVIYSEYNNSDYYKVFDFIHPIRFWLLKTFYVNKSLRNYKKIQKEAEFAQISKKFFEIHKDLARDAKLDKLLNQN
jgi:hypothetical protein